MPPLARVKTASAPSTDYQRAYQGEERPRLSRVTRTAREEFQDLL